jgi:hypothetical protein
MGKGNQLKDKTRTKAALLKELEELLDNLDDPVDFAEEHCGWCSDDYAAECESDGYGGWVPADGSDYSIHDAAFDAIRDFAKASKANAELVCQLLRKRE